MSKKVYIFRYLYDANNKHGLKSQHDQKIASGAWPKPDVDKDGGVGWWIGVPKLEEGFLTSPDYPNQDYNLPEFTQGKVKGGKEPVPVKYGDKFDYNFNPEYGKGIYLAGIEIDDEDINCVLDFTFEMLLGNVNDVWVIYILHKLSSLATGYLDDGDEQQEIIMKILPKGTMSTVEAIPTNNTTFICWSHSRLTNDCFQSGSTFTHQVNFNSVYFAIIDKSDIIKKQFCYYGIDNVDVCEPCSFANGIVIDVFFDKDEFDEHGLEGSVWYDDETLTTTVQNGAYRQLYVTGAAIYNVESGIPQDVEECVDVDDEC